MSDRTTRNHVRPVVAASILLAVIAGLQAGCASGAAGRGGTASAPTQEETAAPSPEFAGTWKGPFTIGMGGGDVVLILERSGESLTGSVTVAFEGETLYGTIYRQTFEGTGCDFWVTLDVYDIHMTGRIEEGHLKGDLRVFMESEAVDGGSFILRKG